jgi:RimJ/RimL family protein N-acetyltransferase
VLARARRGHGRGRPLDPEPRELAEQSFVETLPVNGVQSTHWRFVIEKDGISVGTVNAQLSDPILREAEIGIELLPAYRNQGIRSEALAALIGFLRCESNILKLSAGCFADNLRSRRALEKAGMELRSVFSRFWLKGADWKDGAFFELILDDRRAEV